MAHIDSPPQPPGGSSDEPLVRLERWKGEWPADDPFAGLKTDVTLYSHADPLETLHGLSEASGIPVGALVRYVLARWAAGGSDGLLELGVSGVDHLARIVADAEVADSEAARLEAYTAMSAVVSWLRAGLDDLPGDRDRDPEL